MAESRRQSSSPDSLFVSQDHHYNNEHHAAQRPPPPLALPPRPRYAGDGLDYRRPARTAAAADDMGSNNVIDLTLEDDAQSEERIAPEASLTVETPEPGPSSRTQQRLPRFQSRNIIDVESDVEEHEEGLERGRPSNHHHRRNNHNHHSTAPHHPPRDNDIMNAQSSTSTTAAPSRRLPRPWELAEPDRSITPHLAGPITLNRNTIDLTADDDDDLVLTEVRPRVMPQLNVGAPEATAGLGTRGVMDAVMARVGGALGFGGLGGGRVPPQIEYNARHQVQLPGGGVAMNLNFDYMAVAFAVGAEPARAPTPQYEAPPKPEAGFTRSPGEDEEVVCPNCGDELCMGENETKQEVWVVKGCGHVSSMARSPLYGVKSDANIP